MLYFILGVVCVWLCIALIQHAKINSAISRIEKICKDARESIEKGGV